MSPNHGIFASATLAILATVALGCHSEAQPVSAQPVSYNSQNGTSYTAPTPQPMDSPMPAPQPSDQDKPTTMTNTPGQSGQPGQPSQVQSAMTDTTLAPSDGDALAILRAADKAEVHEGEFAKIKASTSAVKMFAGHMVVDHTRDLAAIVRLEATTNVMANTSCRDAEEIMKGEQGEVDALRTKVGKDLDRAYVDNQAKAHEKVLQLLDATIPNLKNDAIRQHVTMARAKIESHLRHALDLRSKM